MPLWLTIVVCVASLPGGIVLAWHFLGFSKRS